VVALALAARAGAAGAATPYDGLVTLDDGALGGVVATLDVLGSRVTGSLSLGTDNLMVAGDYAVRGRRRGRRFTLKGSSSAGSRVKWSGRRQETGGWNGVVRLRGAEGRLRGELMLAERAAPGGGTPGGGGGGAGAVLYGEKCAACHGAEARGGNGFPAVRCNRDIQDAVKRGRTPPGGGVAMPAFLRMTDAEIGLIQGFLGELCPAPTASGADLFAGNCTGCHGADARGRTAPSIRCARSIGDAVRNGIRGPLGYMAPLMRLTDPEIQRIQDHLLDLCPVGSATAAELFGSNCAACHGVAAAGDGDRRPRISCTVPSRLTHAVRRGRGFAFPVMPSWGPATLDDAELAGIIAYTRSFCSGQAADLFASNCATCHGATATGGRNADEVAGPSIRCASSGDVFDAVVDGYGGMPALSDMPTPQINAIVTFLRAGCP
jgi:mono/diheme cytochrome c family protein